MEPTNMMLLAQALSLSGLIGASGAYVGIIRRRRDGRIEMQAAAEASDLATARVGRQIALGRIEHTFIRSAYRRRDPDSTKGRD